MGLPSEKQVSDRKARLMACAAAWELNGTLTSPSGMVTDAVRLGERIANGQADALKEAGPMWADVTKQAEWARRGRAGTWGRDNLLYGRDLTLFNLASLCVRPVPPTVKEVAHWAGSLGDVWVDILNDLVPPVAQLSMDEAERMMRAANDREVRCLAEAVERLEDWPSLPVLADALEEAGCPDGEVLWHLRGRCRGCQGTGKMVGFQTPRKKVRLPHEPCGGTGKIDWRHFRGCWALDLTLRRW